MTRRAVALLIFLAVGCASPRARTPLETRADAAYAHCWGAGGPTTPDFVAIEERGRLYAVMSHVSGQKFDAVRSCLRARGVEPIWALPPSQMGGR